MRNLGALLVYSVAACVYTWPLIAEPTRRLGAHESIGDPYLNLWILGWNLGVLRDSPRAILDGRILEAPIFHPTPQTLLFSDHQIPQAMAVWPIHAATGHLVLSYNLLLLASLVASAGAMHAYARLLTGLEPASYVAGLAWGFWPYRFAHLIHLQLQALYWLPLALLFLHKVVAGCRVRHALALGVTLGLQAVFSVYYGIIGALALAAAAPALAVAAGGRLGRVLLRLTLAAAVSAALVAPIAWQYRQAQFREGFGRSLAEAERHAARPASYLTAGPTNLLYGGSWKLTGEDNHERQLFPGFVLVALAILGLADVRSRAGRPAMTALVTVALVGFVLSLGPGGIRPVYSTLYGWLPGFEAIRAPARFGVLVALAVAGLAALGVGGLARAAAESSRRRWIVRCVIPLVALEYLNGPILYVQAPPARTALGQWLREATAPGAVIHLPLEVSERNTAFMLQALEHGRPLVNGYSGQRPAAYGALVAAMGSFPSAEAFWALGELGVRFVVTHETVASSWPVVERARFDRAGAWSMDRAVVYEVEWTSEAKAKLVPPSAPAPPPPGPSPFEMGETLVYSVRWTSGPAAVPAGTAVLSVERPGGSDAPAGTWRFVALAETAAWVSRFYEARDRFETVADALLRPLVHRRHLQEGQRRQALTVTYDHENLVARRQSAAEAALALRLPAGSRDPVTALYYARTRSWPVGARLALPINDAGKNLWVDVASAGVDRITIGARSERAVRLVPRVRPGVGARAPVDTTVWVSLDERRVPLRIAVAAGFGRIEADLVDYRRR